MKKTLLLFLLAGLLVPVDAQVKSTVQQEQLNLDLDMAKRTRNVGLVMTVTGGVAAIGGSVMATNGLFRHYPDTPGKVNNDTYSTMGGVIGLCLVITGVSLVCIGIPVFSIGSMKYHKAQKSLQISLVEINGPDKYTPVNGLGLTLRF
ncbi:MAG: hypothetical protein U0X39_05805 [Bacteroidales bacterium]